MPEIVLSAVGPDRPGLVDEFTGFLNARGANIADARMVNLRGQFALVLMAEVPEGREVDLPEQARQAGEKLGLTVVATPQRVKGSPPEGVPYRLRTYAMDQPGIVHRLTHQLHQHHINIEELETHLQAGPHSGTPLFTMEVRMTVPPSLSIKRLREDLTNLCDSLNCDMDLEPA